MPPSPSYSQPYPPCIPLSYLFIEVSDQKKKTVAQDGIKDKATIASEFPSNQIHNTKSLLNSSYT